MLKKTTIKEKFEKIKEMNIIKNNNYSSKGKKNPEKILKAYRVHHEEK